MTTSKQLVAAAIAGLLMIATACADSTAPRRDCPLPSGGSNCTPG